VANAAATISAMAIASTEATPMVALRPEAMASTPGIPREMWEAWVLV